MQRIPPLCPPQAEHCSMALRSLNETKALNTTRITYIHLMHIGISCTILTAYTEGKAKFGKTFI